MTNDTTTKFTGEATMRHYLPFFDTPLRGRDADMTAIQAMLAQSGIVQIIGEHGIGKSRLVAEIARTFPNGVVWHRGSRISLVGDILRALRIHFDLPDDIPVNNIIVLLEKYRPLLVIDNANVISSYYGERANYEGFLNRIVSLGVPVLLIDTFSWDKLNSSKEYPLTPLDTDTIAQITADIAQRYNIALSPDQIAELTRLTRHHLPLITFVVGLLNDIVPYDHIVNALNNLDGYSQLQVESAHDKMMFKMTRYMLAHAENGDHADALLKRLSWIEHPVTIDLIRTIKPDTIPDEDTLARAISTLMAYNFLHHDKITDTYRLEANFFNQWGSDNGITQYDDNPDENHHTDFLNEMKMIGVGVFIAYNDYYTARAKTLFADLFKNPDSLRQHEADYLHIVTIGDEWLRRTHNGERGDLIRLLHFLDSLGDYVIYRSQHKIVDWLNAGLNAITQLRQTSAHDADKLVQLEASLSRRLGGIFVDWRDSMMAQSSLTNALSLYRATGDKAGQARTLMDLGMVAHKLSVGQADKARDFLGQALQLYRDIDDKYSEIESLYAIGDVWFMSVQNYQTALTYYEQALTITRQIGNLPLQEWRSAMTIGVLWSLLKDNQKALQFFNESLIPAQVVGNPLSLARTYNNIGNIQTNPREAHQALDTYKQSLALYQQAGDKEGEALVLQNISNVYVHLGNRDEGIRYIEQAIAITPLDSPSMRNLKMGYRIAKLRKNQPFLLFLIKIFFMIFMVVRFLIRFIFSLPRRIVNRVSHK